MSNNQWGQPPNDQWGGNQWEKPPTSDQWGGNQWEKPPTSDQWGGNQWGQQQQPQQQWQQQPSMGQMPPYMQAERSGCCLKWVLGSSFLMVFLCVGCSLGVFFAGKSFFNLTPSVAAFMDAGQNNDVDAAMAVLSRSPDLTEAEIEHLFDDRELFEDYKDINFPNQMNAAEIKMENMRLNATGRINYTTGEDGTYYAKLIKEDGKWLLEDISITR